jgi:Ni2+-binding GTPase involved in maturation of urease and hydrogenase
VDKPLKYPVMFQNADLVLVTKIDLLPHLPDVDLTSLRENLARVMPEPRNIAVSALTGQGIDHWLQWLAERRAAEGLPKLRAQSGSASIAHTREEHEHVQSLD